MTNKTIDNLSLMKRNKMILAYAVLHEFKDHRLNEDELVLKLAQFIHSYKQHEWVQVFETKQPIDKLKNKKRNNIVISEPQLLLRPN